MTCSCSTSGISKLFDDAKAKKDLRRYQRKGPDPTTRMLIDALRALVHRDPSSELTMLDVGGGVGILHHELIDGKIREAVHVDASPAFIALARNEAQRRGHADQVQFVLGDFVEVASQVGAADLVTLDRVICCYPDMDRLVTQSGAKARRYYGAVYPRDRRAVRVVVAIMNFFFRLRRLEFRSHVHPVTAIVERLRASGLELVERRQTFVWEVAVFRRAREA